MQAKKERILLWLAFIGTIFSFLLLLVDGKNATVSQFCSVSQYFDCTKIASSQWSYLGPIPIAAIGLFFYLFIGFYGLMTDRVELYFKISAWLFLVASLFSLFLLGVSLFSIQAFCIYCTVTYLVNWICLFLLKNHLKFSFSGFWAKDNLISLALAIVFSLILTAISIWATNSYGGLEQKTAQNPNEIIKKYQEAYVYKLNTIFTPYKGSSNPKVELIVYSDFFCHYCQDFMSKVEALMENPVYKENIRVYFKAYPLEKDCNPNVFNTLYSGSCALAFMGFELMKKGLFWEYEKQLRSVYPLTFEKGKAIAEQLNQGPFNEKKLLENMRYTKINGEEGKSLGITGTPSWFLNGRAFYGTIDIQSLKILFDYAISQGK